MPVQETGNIGVVATLTGTVTALDEAGNSRELHQGDPVHQDDTILTGNDSSVELKFEDGTVFSQGAKSEVLLDVYIYNPEAGTGELLFNIASGSLRAFSGEIAKLNPQGFEVETPLSTVGIRGTGFFVILGPEGEVVGVEQMDPTHMVVVETEMGQVTMTLAGNYVAVQLDGFLSDPTMFTPEFLQSVHDMAPLTNEIPTSTTLPDQQQENGNDGNQDNGGQPDNGQPDEVPDETGQDTGENSNETLQGLAENLGRLKVAMDHAGDKLGPGDIGDALGHLPGHWGRDWGLGKLLHHAARHQGNDDLIDTIEEAVQSLLDLRALLMDADGSDYQAIIESQGYTAEVGTAGADTMNGTAGQDAYFGLGDADTLTGGPGADILFGGAGGDTLTGGTGVDIVYGGTGADIIFGGLGSDYLVGGNGSDEFKYADITEIGDTIRDFTHGEDTIKFHTANFQAGNFGAMIIPNWTFDQGVLNAYCTAVYDPTTAKVYVDIDGSGGVSSPVLVATLENAPQDVTDADFGVY